MAYGVNTIGPPSVLSFVNAPPLLFNEDLVWLMDCEYYMRLLRRYGPPARSKHFNTIVRVGDHQLTNHISDHVRSREADIVLDSHPEYRRFRGLRTAWARGRRALYRVRMPALQRHFGGGSGGECVFDCLHRAATTLKCMRPSGKRLRTPFLLPPRFDATRVA